MLKKKIVPSRTLCSMEAEPCSLKFQVCMGNILSLPCASSVSYGSINARETQEAGDNNGSIIKKRIFGCAPTKNRYIVPWVKRGLSDMTKITATEETLSQFLEKYFNRDKSEHWIDWGEEAKAYMEKAWYLGGCHPRSSELATGRFQLYFLARIRITRTTRELRSMDVSRLAIGRRLI